MDEGQKWAIGCTRQALDDYGYPERPFDLNRTAVILGNAMAGERHYLTSFRLYFPEFAHELAETRSFAALPATVRGAIATEYHDRVAHHLPEITEDTMPGELANCIAGRIANTFNFRGPNYVVDAACASAMAALSSAVEGLIWRSPVASTATWAHRPSSSSARLVRSPPPAPALTQKAPTDSSWARAR
jgi:acyl transferase domain-containing protein